MSEAIEEQIEALKQSIAALEAQRNTIPDEVLRAALVPLQQKLTELEAQLRTTQQAGLRAVEQQRKQVTVLFMDFGGSTQLVNKMDPEEAMEVFDSALNQLGKVVESHGGRVTRYTGDGLMAVFGTPMAREDDPQRAVLTGLGLVEKARQLGEELDITGLAVRVGVNTGLVAVGGLTEAEDTLMGSAVNLASRLENAASIGSVLISHETFRNVRDVFLITESAPVVAKGFAEPVRAYLVQGTKARSFRQPLRGVEGLETHMVGREGELKCLQEALMSALESGEGQVVTVSGEAGVGKSRLLDEFRNWMEQKPVQVRLYQGRGRVEEQGQPFALLREAFAERFEILEDESPETVREKFVHGFQQGCKEQGEMKAHLSGQMLGYDFKDSPHLIGVLGKGEQLHNRGIMYIGEYFLEMSHQEPVVLLLEDIHWADDSTLDVVNWLEERMDKLRMLVVCAGRESLFERRPYWGEGEERHTRLSLKPLTKRESRELVEQILRQVAHLPETLRDLIVENAEGNPFYLEELIKMLIEDGVILKGEVEWQVEPERLHGTTIPSTLTGVLQARLDGLPAEERIVLQEASVVGRQFWDRVVAYVHAGGNPEAYGGLLQERLSSLRKRELVFRRETSAFTEAHEYLFKHDLLREVTYESVLKRVRRAHHGLVADWLIANASGRVSEYAGLIGEHLVLAGRGEEAVTYLLQAGETALGAYSIREAEGFYQHVLQLNLSGLQQLTALHGLGKALRYQGKREQAIQTFRKGIELSRQLGNQDGLAQLVYQLCRAQGDSMYRGYSESWQVCQQVANELENAPDSPGLARLLGETGRAAFFTHQLKEVTITYCQRAIAMAERLGLVDVQLEASITLGLADPDVDESLRIFEQTALQAEGHNLPETALRAYINLSMRKTWKYDFSGIVEYLHKELDLVQKIGDIPELLFILMVLAEQYFDIGKMQQVPALIERYLEGVNIPEQLARETQLDIAMMLHSSNGEWEQALEISRQRLLELRRHDDRPAIVFHNDWVIDNCIEMVDRSGETDLTEAEMALNEIIEINKENIVPLDSIYNQICQVQIEALKGQVEQARQLLEECEPLVDKENADHMRYLDRARFFLARAEECWDEAVTIAQSLLARYQDSGALWYLARFRINLGDALRGRDKPGDREHARQAYQEALDLFTEMGATGFVQVVQKRLETLLTEPT